MSNQLPHNLEAEQSLLARLLLDPSQVPLIAGMLSADEFYNHSNRLTYAAMLKLANERKPIDLTTLRDVANDPELEIPLLSLTIGHHAPLEEYANIIKREAFRRKFITSLQRAEQKAYEVDDEQDLLNDLQETVTAILKHVEPDQLISPNTAIDMYLVEVDKRKSSGVGLKYGIDAIDTQLQPARGGNMIVLAARPGIGKTALAQVVTMYWATISPHPVLFVSLEMGLSELMDRWVASESNMDISEVVGSMHDDRVKAATSSLSSSGVWLLDNSFATTSDIRAAAAKIKMLYGGVSGIVVDYIQLVNDKGDPEVTRITRISRALKAIAREFDCPLLALSQLNRASEARSDRHPMLKDLRDSGAIEQDADVVLGLYRDNLSTPQMDIDILKNRSGPSGARIFLNLHISTLRVT